jgi:hypothetical protein
MGDGGRTTDDGGIKLHRKDAKNAKKEQLNQKNMKNAEQRFAVIRECDL